MRNEITEGLNNLVLTIQQYRDEVEQVEKDNNKLNENLQALEKERDEGYESFNTDTHILVKRETLESVKSTARQAKEYVSDAKYETDEITSYAQNAYNQVEYAEDYMDDLESLLTDILREEEEAEE